MLSSGGLPYEGALIIVATQGRRRGGCQTAVEDVKERL